MSTTNLRNFRADAIRSLPLPMFRPDITPEQRLLAIEEEIVRLTDLADAREEEGFGNELRSLRMAVFHVRDEIEQREEARRAPSRRERLPWWRKVLRRVTQPPQMEPEPVSEQIIRAQTRIEKSAVL